MSFVAAQSRVAAALIDGEEPTGAMVAIRPSLTSATSLARPDGEPFDALHTTIAYLGEAEDIDVDQRSLVEAVARDLAAKILGNIEAVIIGMGQFGEDGEAVVALVDIDTPVVDEIKTHRDLLDGIDGIEVARNHDFNPHITIRYVEPGEDMDPGDDVSGMGVTFDAVTVHWGPDVTVFPLKHSRISRLADLRPAPEPVSTAVKLLGRSGRSAFLAVDEDKNVGVWVNTTTRNTTPPMSIREAVALAKDPQPLDGGFRERVARSVAAPVLAEAEPILDPVEQARKIEAVEARLDRARDRLNDLAALVADLIVQVVDDQIDESPVNAAITAAARPQQRCPKGIASGGRFTGPFADNCAVSATELQTIKERLESGDATLGDANAAELQALVDDDGPYVQQAREQLDGLTEEELAFIPGEATGNPGSNVGDFDVVEVPTDEGHVIDNAWAAIQDVPEVLDTRTLEANPDLFETVKPPGGFSSLRLKDGARVPVVDSAAGQRPEDVLAGAEPIPPMVFDVEPAPPGSIEAYSDRIRPTWVTSNSSLGMVVEVEDSRRVMPYVYRVMDEREWAQAQDRGFIQSDQRMNLGAEGTVASYDSTGSFYLPPRGSGASAARIARISVDPEDGWFMGSDGYVKTHRRVPIERVSAITQRLIVEEDDLGMFRAVDVRASFVARHAAASTARDQQRCPQGIVSGGQFTGPFAENCALTLAEISRMKDALVAGRATLDDASPAELQALVEDGGEWAVEAGNRITALSTSDQALIPGPETGQPKPQLSLATPQELSRRQAEKRKTELQEAVDWVREEQSITNLADRALFRAENPEPDGGFWVRSAREWLAATDAELNAAVSGHLAFFDGVMNRSVDELAATLYQGNGGLLEPSQLLIDGMANANDHLSGWVERFGTPDVLPVASKKLGDAAANYTDSEGVIRVHALGDGRTQTFNHMADGGLMLDGGNSYQDPDLHARPWLADRSMSGLIRHEYGHHVDASLRPPGSTPGSSSWLSSAPEWSRAYDGVRALHLGSKKYPVSVYGVTNDRELWAEVFSVHTNPSWSPKRYNGGIDRLVELQNRLIEDAEREGRRR